MMVCKRGDGKPACDHAFASKVCNNPDQSATDSILGGLLTAVDAALVKKGSFCGGLCCSKAMQVELQTPNICLNESSGLAAAI